MKQEKSSETFFSQQAPPVTLGGIFLILSLVPIIFAVNDKDFPGWGIFLQTGATYAMLLPAVLGVLLWMIFFCRVRFEADHATIYYCVFFPVRISYADVTGMSCFYQSSKKPESPSIIMFRLRSGKVKSWNVNCFSAKNSECIKNELEKRIKIPDSQSEIPDFQLWVDRVRRIPRSDKLILGSVAVFALIFACGELSTQLEWNRRVRNWDKVDGIILKNRTKKIRDGKRTKKVADIEYKYTYQGKSYRSSRIVYDSDMFPAVKAGRKQTVIVNPEKPQDCAIMFRYDWAGGFIIRWENCTLWALAGLISLVLFFKAVSTKNIIVPDKLKNYMRTISAERFCQALNLERPGPLPGSVTLCRPMEYLQEFRYGIIRSGGSLGSKFIFSILFLAAVTMSVYVTICWIAAVVTGWVMYKFCTVRMTVFDFQEKKIFFSKSFDPEKTAKLKSLPFADVDHLKCHAGQVGRGGKFIVLGAVMHNGMMVPLCKVSESRLGLLLDLLPELAEKMGHLPITYL